ncbi:MAG: type I-U CRISPR-associated protein Csx17, partial [Dactylosporangium sp.]|nr:type I-U CRISPR-associated protein Csx17 [Dactylosporangium sp.]
AAHQAAARYRGGSWNNADVAREFRNRCPDAALPWIDAATVLADNEIFYPPLLGTGGNDGRFDFAGNLHQHLVRLLDPSPVATKRRLALVRDLLSGAQSEPLTPAAVGQFDPAAAGGRNSSPFGAADSLVNPWAYVLMVEGALMFAATAARRNLHGAGRAAIPFTVAQSPEGSPSGADEASRGELWAPLWERPLTYPEIRHIFGEARAAWRGRPVQQAVEFYAATRTLGVARGIDAFVRYGIHQRNGQAHVAVPIERVRVRNRPAVALAARIEGWVKQARRGDASTTIGQAARRYDAAYLEFAKTGEPVALGRLLATVTELEMAVGRSGRARETVRVRVPPNAQRFLDVLCAAESPELRLAVGLASCRTLRGATPARTMRQILLPVDPGRPRPEWRPTPIVAGFGVRPLERVLTDVLIWRARTGVDEQPGQDGDRPVRGVRTFRSGIPVPAADLHAWAQQRLDDDLVLMWLKACLALDWRGVRHTWTEQPAVELPLPLLGMLHALANGVVSRQDGGDERSGPVLGLQPDWPVRLAAGKLADVHAEAGRRLSLAGITVADAASDTALRQLDGARVAAALVPRCAQASGVLTRYLSTSEDEQTPDLTEDIDEENDSEIEEDLS